MAQAESLREFCEPRAGLCGVRHSLAWAERTFGDANLGDARRTARLVEVADGVCARPAGRLTQVFHDPAQREGAFRLIENSAVCADEVARASHRATARSCSNEPFVFVPVDETSLSFTDVKGSKFGPTSNKNVVHRGMFAMSALAVNSEGTPLGTLALEYWLRPEARCPKWKQDRRAGHERQSHLWRRALQNAAKVMNAHAPDCRPWFQLDRGADCGDVLALAHQQSLFVTVRSAHNRAIEGRAKDYLRPRLKAQPVLARMTVNVPARKQQPARVANLQVRATRLRFRVAKAGKKRRSVWVEMWAVFVSEPQRRKNAIQWMLWTTFPVTSAENALKVVRGYSMRWRVEEFHRAWKSGHCDIESSQLRSPAAMQRWGAITAAVAARAEHLKLRSRTEPEAAALSELTQHEIDAAILLSETRKHKPGDAITLEQAVDLIARIGGYIGKASGGPPGTATISRGLDRVAAAAKVLALGRSG